MAILPKSIQNLVNIWSYNGKLFHRWFYIDGRSVGAFPYLYLKGRNNISIYRLQNFQWKRNERFKTLNVKILAASAGGLAVFVNHNNTEEDPDIEEKMEIENRYFLGTE